MTFWDFEGAWVLTKDIDEARAQTTGRFTGTANFELVNTQLHYTEAGVLHMDGQTPLQAQQCYIWHIDSQGMTAEIHFADGRPFHDIAMQPKTSARHLCAPDTYDVDYDFTTLPEWTARWSVAGPRKDYDMVARYRRA